MDLNSELTSYINQLLAHCGINANIEISQDVQWVSLTNFNNYGYNFGFIFNIKNNVKKTVQEIRQLSVIKMDDQSERYKISLLEAGIKEGDLINIEVLASEYAQQLFGR